MRSSSSTTDAVPEPLPERIVVGRVVRAHGVRGAVVVEPMTDVASRFVAGARLDLVAGDHSRRRVELVAVESAARGLRVRLSGIDDRDAAQALSGAWFEVARVEVPRAPAGAYYEFELVGCCCRDERAGPLGIATALIESGAGPLIEVALDDGRRVALPFVESFVVKVDRDRRTIDWRLPEGLIEACASRS